jgi:UDP-N-acetylglucosamine 2-epimerase
MQGIEGVVQAYRPDLMAVVGDVNSTLAAALVANKTGCNGGPRGKRAAEP